MAADAEAVELERERQAIARAQAGDLSALEPLLAAAAEPLFAIVLPRVGDRAQAEDIVKEAMVTALEKIGRFSWQGRNLFFWLRQIALRKVIDLHRRRSRGGRLLAALEVEAAASTRLPAADDALIAEEDRLRVLARVHETLSALPERYARAIRLRLVDERPRHDCADALGVTVGNFDVILFRALTAFRSAYGDR